MLRYAAEMSEAMAREIATVGMIPARPRIDIRGTTVEFAGHPFHIGNEVTRQEFMARVVEVGLDAARFLVPEDFHFYRVSTD